MNVAITQSVNKEVPGSIPNIKYYHDFAHGMTRLAFKIDFQDKLKTEVCLAINRVYSFILLVTQMFCYFMIVF